MASSELPPPAPAPSPTKKHAHVLASPRSGPPTTPLSSWKLYQNPSYLHSSSARKLAASLWASLEHRKPPSVALSPCTHLQPRPSPSSTLDSSQFMQCSSSLQPSFQPTDVSTKTIQPNINVYEGQTTEEIPAMQDPPEFFQADDSTGLMESTLSYGSSVEMDEIKHAIASVEEFKLGADETQSSTEELSELLGRLRSLEDQQGASFSLIAALRLELEHAHGRVQELEHAQKSARREIDRMLRTVEEERTTAHNKEQERAKSAIRSLREEIEAEKKARRNLETVNRRLSRDLSEANKALAKAINEIEQERKTRELMEDVCDELAKEIGRDKAEVEQLKSEHAKVREELGEERKMLQMAELWREERVQLKLAEARIEFEEKIMTLDKLKNELEAFLKNHRSSDSKIDDLVRETEIQDASYLLHEARKASSWKLEADIEGYTKGREWNSEATDVIDHLNYEDESGECVLDRLPRFADQRQLPRMTKHYLDRFGESQLSQGSYGDSLDCMQDGNNTDGGSEREYTSENRTGESDASNWSADCDEDNDKMEESSPWNSVTDVEGDDTDDFSSDFNGRHNFRRLIESQSRGENESYSRSVQRMSTMRPMKEVNFPIYSDSLKGSRIGNSRVAGSAFSSPPRQKPGSGLEVSGLKSQQSSQEGSSRHASRAMKGSVEWPKSYKSNSLQAKLLEARMESKKACSKYLPRFK